MDASFKDRVFKVNLGPYKDGNYFIHGKIGDLLAPFFPQVPRSFKYKLPAQNLEDAFFIVKYESPEGWHTLSPILSFQLLDSPFNGFIHWNRP